MIIIFIKKIIARPFIRLLKNIRRFDAKENGTDYYAGWDNALDVMLQDIQEWINY